MSSKAKEAIKTALAISIAYGIVLSQGWGNPVWAGVSAAFVSLSTIGQSFEKAALRMGGTFVAAAVSFVLLGCFVQDRWPFLIALSVWVGYCTYRAGGSRYPYGWQVSGFVAVIVSLEAGFDAANAFHVATLRTQETGLGILVYSVVALLLWPVNAAPKMQRAAVALVESESELFGACLDLMRGGDAAATRALRAKVHQQQGAWKQLLAAAITDSIEVKERRAEWRAFAQQIDALTDALERCCDAVSGHMQLDMENRLPSLKAFQDEIAARLSAISHMLGGGQADYSRTKAPLSIDEAAAAEGTHFERAALEAASTQLLEVESLTRDLCATARAIRGSGEPVPEPKPGADPVSVLDPDRLLAAARSMLALWLASLAVIYIPDLPGGVAVPIFAGCLGIFMGNAPQVSLFKLIAPSLAAVAFGGVIYIFIMPRLSSFAGLGTVIFLATFAICYLFFERKQVLGRTFGLIMFMAVTSISNTQSYSFLSVLDTGLMLVVVLLIISVTSYVPVYLRPDRAILRLLARFFRSSAYATQAVVAGRTEQGHARLPRRDAFHARELAILPDKVAEWRPWVDTKALPGTPSNAIQALADSTAFLSRALTTLVTRVRQIGSPNVGDVLGGDLSAWHAALMQALGKLADDPTLGRVEPVQQHLTEITTRLEARIRDAVDAGQSDSLAPEQREELYLLLAAYRGVSGALMDYVETTASIDWTPWRQERFA